MKITLELPGKDEFILPVLAKLFPIANTEQEASPAKMEKKEKTTPAKKEKKENKEKATPAKEEKEIEIETVVIDHVENQVEEDEVEPSISKQGLWDKFRELAKAKKHEKAKTILDEYGFSSVSNLLENVKPGLYDEIYQKLCEVV